jgi:hypothetical protein
MSVFAADDPRDKARWEETRLVMRYPDHAAYAARTPRFVPLWPA